LTQEKQRRLLKQNKSTVSNYFQSKGIYLQPINRHYASITYIFRLLSRHHKILFK